MLTVADKTILEDFEKAEAENPSPSKVIDDTRTIYRSRKLHLPTDDLWGQPVLCDFGEARIGDSHSGFIQPELYRAPEVLFEMEWGSKVDIWSVATLVSVQSYYREASMTHTWLGVGLV
jgi:serine/threonine protein kinase